jgi:hypothetical protein
MESLAFWKTLHIVGVSLFIGNIIVSALWKVMADRTGDLAVMRFGARLVNPPAATSKSPICGQVKIPQWRTSGRGCFTRRRETWQDGWRLP